LGYINSMMFIEERMAIHHQHHRKDGDDNNEACLALNALRPKNKNEHEKGE